MNTYRVSMRVSRGNWTNQVWATVASNNIGIRFTTFEHTPFNPPAINNYAHLNCDTVITDTLNWVLLEWDLTPDSAYTHLYIGNFFDDANTDTLIINAPNGNEYRHAYYYIDSLNIKCITPGCLTSVNDYLNEESSIYYYDNYLNFSLKKDTEGQLTLYNLLGQVIISQEINGNEKLNLSYLSRGLYVAVIATQNKIFCRKFLTNH